MFVYLQKRPDVDAFSFFFFNDPAPPGTSPLPLPDALPISPLRRDTAGEQPPAQRPDRFHALVAPLRSGPDVERRVQLQLGRVPLRVPRPALVVEGAEHLPQIGRAHV